MRTTRRGGTRFPAEGEGDRRTAARYSYDDRYRPEKRDTVLFKVSLGYYLLKWIQTWEGHWKSCKVEVKYLAEEKSRQEQGCLTNTCVFLDILFAVFLSIYAKIKTGAIILKLRNLTVRFVRSGLRCMKMSVR